MCSEAGRTRAHVAQQSEPISWAHSGVVEPCAQAHLALNFATGADAAELAALGALLTHADAAWREARGEAAEAAAPVRSQASAALTAAGMEHQVGATRIGLVARVWDRLGGESSRWA